MIEWPKTQQEELPWDRSAEVMELIPKSKRRKITSTYLAAVPAKIADLPAPTVPQEILLQTAELSLSLARFDVAQAARTYNLPALMLRSESASSSQIENLTSSVKNVALAELSSMAPSNAELIAGNVRTMRKAIAASTGRLNADAVCDMHDTLMRNTGEKQGLREAQAWIGGTPYSPHGATFVPPHHSRVRELVDDALAFTEREDLDPVVKMAVAHAQFETIHPFTDGNGRTGRVLLHVIGAQAGLLEHSVLPISAGLLHSSESYMQAISAYQQGDAEPIVREMTEALELALVIGARMSDQLDTVLTQWEGRIVERKGSAMHRLAPVLVEQPVVDVKYLAEKLEISERAALNLVEKACDYGILKRMGNAKRGVFYQAPELVEVLEEAASLEGIRRMLRE